MLGAFGKGRQALRESFGTLAFGERAMKRATLVLGWVGMAFLAMMVNGNVGTWVASPAVAAESAAAPAANTDAPAAAPAETKPAAAKDKPAKAAKSKGRLPPYFGAVVTAEQRESIYAIQAEYDPKISQLRKEIEALTKARDEKIFALLTAEQKKKIEELKAAARSPKKKKAAEAK